MDRSVFDNVALPLLIEGVPRRIAQRVRLVWEKVSLGSKKRPDPANCPRGEQQRVGVARALVAQPLLLLADEPTGNLDPSLAAEIMVLLATLSAQGSSVIIASHDLSLVKRMRKRVLVLSQGKLMDDIAPEELAP